MLGLDCRIGGLRTKGTGNSVYLAQYLSTVERREELAMPWRAVGIHREPERPRSDETAVFLADDNTLENVAGHARTFAAADCSEVSEAFGKFQVASTRSRS